MEKYDLVITFEHTDISKDRTGLFDSKICTVKFITWKWTVRFHGREADEPYKSNSTPIG